jgi:hypothetical protein
VNRALSFLNTVLPALSGALLMLVYLKRVEGIRNLQGLQDGMLALLFLTFAARVFIGRRLKAMANG